MAIDWKEFEKALKGQVDMCAAPVPDMDSASLLMMRFIKDRVYKCEARERDTILRFPVALFFARGDRGGSAKATAEEAISSLNYWNLDSGNNIDILFPGWTKKGEINEFDTNLFYQFKEEIESRSKWRFGGESEILLVNFDYNPLARQGWFAFDETISLPLEQMIKKGIISSVDGLMNEIISTSKAVGDGGIWELSDKLGIQRARKSLWEHIKNKVTGGLSTVYDEVRPFAICNLEIDS